MPPSDEDQIDTTGVEPDADAPSQGEMEGSGSSPETVEDQSPRDLAIDEFLKEYGEEPEAPAPEVVPEPQPEDPAPAERQEGAEKPKGSTRLSDEKWNAADPEVRHRLGYLSDQVRQAKAEIGRLEAYRRPAEEMENLRAYAAENNLQPQDIANGFGFMGMLAKGDHEGFFKAFEPIWQRVLQSTGRMAAPDLQAQIDNGDMTPEIAAQLTQAKLAREAAEAAAQREREARESRERQDEAGRSIASMQAAIRAEQLTLQTSDPDYALKAPAIRSMWTTLVNSGWKPESPAAAAKALKDIHANVVIPKPATPLRSTPPSPGASEASRRSAAPKSVLEAIQSAV